jgi:hypothetical protein
MLKEVEFGDQSKSVAQLEELKRSLPVMFEYQLIVAKLIRARYTALIEEKFTEQQALELTKEMFK